MRISGHLLQIHRPRQFLRHLFERPHNPSHHSSQMPTGSVSVLHLILLFPCCPSPHYTRQDSELFRLNSLQPSTCLPVPWNDNQIHDFQRLIHRIRDIPTSEVPPPRYHKLSGSASPLKNHRRPISVYPDSLFSSHRSMFLSLRIHRLLFALHLQL